MTEWKTVLTTYQKPTLFKVGIEYVERSEAEAKLAAADKEIDRLNKASACCYSNIQNGIGYPHCTKRPIECRASSECHKQKDERIAELEAECESRAKLNAKLLMRAVDAEREVKRLKDGKHDPISPKDPLERA